MPRLNNREVAHAWASMGNPDCTVTDPRGSNFYAVGPTLYSYGPHFVVGHHVGDFVVLLNSRSYSSSTNRHQSYARHAVSHLEVYTVPWPTEPHNPENLAHLAAIAPDLLLRASRCRGSRWESRDDRAARLLGQAVEARQKAEDYRRRFLPEAAPVPHLDTSTPLSEIREAAALASRAEAARQKADAEARQERDRAAFENWRSGSGPCPISYHTDPDGCYYLRLRGDLVETSGGASVPIDSARRLWSLLPAMMTRTDKPPVLRSSVSLGYYSLSSVSKRGDIVVGCHKIRYAELARIADCLGLPAHTERITA